MGNPAQSINSADAKSKSPEKKPTGDVTNAETGKDQDRGGFFTVVEAPYQSVMKFLNRRVLARATLSVPRTVKFVSSNMFRGNVTTTSPVPTLTPSLVAHVAVDEAILAMAMTPRRFPRRSDYVRVGEEMIASQKLFSRRGWLQHPASYHQEPPALTAGDVTATREKSRGRNYSRLTWESGFAPHTGIPGSDHWMSYQPNRTASTNILEHKGEPRPWVVCVHGFCMGFPLADFMGLHVDRIHDELGFNVAMPVLPLHGPRKVTLISGEPLLSFDLMNAVHGLTQAVWDIRRLIGWIAQRGGSPISLYGVSLGGNVVSLLAGLEDRVDAVVAGIPVSDFPALYAQHSPRHVQARAIEHHIMGGPVEDVFRVVSPFSFAPTMPVDRRFIYAGHADRIATPAQAQRLWEYWDEPSISWYHGNHVGYLWSKQVADFVCDSLGRAARLFQTSGHSSPTRSPTAPLMGSPTRPARPPRAVAK